MARTAPTARMTARGSASRRSHPKRQPAQPNPKRQRVTDNKGDDDGDDDKDDEDDGDDPSSGSDSEEEDERRRVLQSLPIYGGVPTPVIVEPIVPPVGAIDGILANCNMHLAALPTMIPHQGSPDHNPCPFVANSLCRHLVPITSMAQFDALPVGALLHVFWQSPTWPDAFFAATKIS